ncbi:spore coat protein GerQ [Cytobacillus purgationiresistens]|uniref:Spore germination protein Q n=1 Tax=Cytobacillus purgationiresistens TaxID=863449 RepID=A0ABU0AKJ2_9BACI|nr:spore coat protein GerQ [Cytobacillus purgationiresistens]MDQ0271772.1 spore germination protein Q [Cytobacillus purgationiresistens]
MTQQNYPYNGYQQRQQQQYNPNVQNFQQQGYTPQPQASYPTVPSGMNIPTAGSPTLGPDVPGMLPIQQSYIENILRLNKGKLATVYTTFENNTQWNAKVFKGIIEAAGRDHLILSDPETGLRYLIPMIYLDYVTFNEEIEYDYPHYGGQGMTQYTPR